MLGTATYSARESVVESGFLWVLVGEIARFHRKTCFQAATPSRWTPRGVWQFRLAFATSWWPSVAGVWSLPHTMRSDACWFIPNRTGRSWLLRYRPCRISASTQARRLQRLLLGYATPLEMDGNGRILLSPTLREFAGLEKDLMLTGLGNKLEIWSDKAWNDWLDEAGEADDLPDEALSLNL